MYPVSDKGLTPAIPEDIHPELAQLMRDCWKIDPDQRPVRPSSN